jgi:formylglycine-generating enzyme required for sulfatase activity
VFKGIYAGLARNRIAALKEEQTAAVASPPPPQPPPAPKVELEPVEATYVAVKNANVREQPTVRSAKVGRLDRGAEVHIAGKVKGQNWYLVERDDKRLGYVYGDLLRDADTARREEEARRQEEERRQAEETRRQEEEARRIEEERKRAEEARRREEEHKRTEEARVAVAQPPKPQAPSTATPAVGIYPRGRQPGETFQDCADCPEMVVIPAGSFMMGSPASEEGHQDDEGPQRLVTISRTFALGKYEVTFAEWDACVSDGGCSHRPYDEGWGGGDRPVIDVNWHDAMEYVSWLSRKTGLEYSLPSEAQWEYAARAGTTSSRFWGEDRDSACGYANAADQTAKEQYPDWTTHECRDGYVHTAPVGSFRANGFGLHDIVGNVWEWVEDCYNDSYIGAPSDGSAWTTGECSFRVLRGASWYGIPSYFRTADRLKRIVSSFRGHDIGFRVTRALAPPLVPERPSVAEPAVGVYPSTRPPGETLRDCAECPEMVVIPAGSFMMGSPASETQREQVPAEYALWPRPQHRVTITRAFALGKHEVTRAEFAAFVSATGQRTGNSCWTYESGTWEWRDGRDWRTAGYGQGDREPVVCVSWEDAQEYVRWLSRKTGQDYRLPSEAEWEYAARAGTTKARFWGNEPDSACRYANVHDRTSKAEHQFDWSHHDCRDGYPTTAAVGSFQANRFGLHDVLGNVWEWVEDCWNEGYDGAPTGGSAWTSGDCSRRVLRGGSWSNPPWSVVSAGRDWIVPVARTSILGFRVARTLR